MKKKNKFRPLLKLIKEDRKKLIFASILIVIESLAGLLTGYLNGAAVEAITLLQVKKALIFLGVYFSIEVLIDGLMSSFSNALLLTVESKLTRKLGYNTYIKALNLPAVAFEEKSSGEIINRITNDSSSLSFTFGHLLSMVTGVIGSFIILIYVFMNSWIVGIEILAFLSTIFIVLKIFNPKLKDAHKERKTGQDKFTSLVNESIRGIREIKTLGIKKHLVNEARNINEDLFGVSKKEIDIQKNFNRYTRIIKAILEVGVFATCVVLLYYKQINLTFFVAMTYYVYRYMWLIENINDLSQTYQKVSVSIERVNELLENTLYNDVEFGDKTIKNIKGVIEFKHVTFGYPNEDVTLKDFNLKIEPNKKVAIVGASGQGKSTLFNLITRIFDPNMGEITLDGVNIKDLTEDELVHHISIIRQEPFIFNRTILDNFKLIDNNIKLSEVRKYAKLAYIDDYIMGLPKKYDTLLGEGGVNLSGGQKQRLSIARTLSKGSKVILFDEATSALDNNSQGFIKQAIDDIAKTHTVVIVAHRLSTIQDADVIHVVDKGKIVASGTHEELMNTSKIYKNLYKSESLNS